MKNKILDRLKAKLRKKYGYSTITHDVNNVNKLYLRRYMSDADDTVLGIDLGMGASLDNVFIGCDGVHIRLKLEELALLGDVAKELIREREELR